MGPEDLANKLSFWDIIPYKRNLISDRMHLFSMMNNDILFGQTRTLPLIRAASLKSPIEGRSALKTRTLTLNLTRSSPSPWSNAVHFFLTP